MPELPEVEVTRMGIAPYVEGKKITQVVTRRDGLRWPFPRHLSQLIEGKKVLHTSRRSKYLLLHFEHGILMIHLGMSGYLRVLPTMIPPEKHDHIDWIFGKLMVRMNDARRFGAVLWHDAEDGDFEKNALICGLGVEPLGESFTPRMMFEATRKRQTSIKQVLLAGDVVVGVGNIYACESLFQAGIRPTCAAGQISLPRYEKLVNAIKQILKQAIEQGGSTLKDFRSVNGQSGYFQQSYFVYGRVGQACRVCHNPVKQLKQGQRSSFYCVKCQK